ncbi:MAG TPA: DUF418 domain-containing protein [Allosphingosinicella sp.]|jgi:uncharacterized protein|uniref:DUF418 domain-containing protein n=1 Tax=Allosphingosinicella sp. TaxID=2823234 RepID=UPI002F2A18A0
MTAADSGPPRILTLDIVRGVAVMGILAMNIVGFGLPFQAYMNPAALGAPETADMISWALSFVVVDGKMRGLFSFLFGASILLVIQRADASGRSGAAIHYRRMGWLLVFGLLHFYLVWFGDILVGYALIGMLAYLFRNKEPRALIAWACGLLLVQFLIFLAMSAGTMVLEQQAAAPGAPAETVRQWQDLQRMFGALSGAELDKVLNLFRGSYPDIVGHRLSEQGAKPFSGLPMFGWETLAYMLLGMAALKTGFLTGAWADRDYRRIMLIGFGIGVPAYALLAWAYARSGFSMPMTFAYVMAATVPFRPLMILATASLIILLTRGGGGLTARIAAAGRAAFTNYLGTSIVLTTFFYGYGFGYFGTMGRAELWMVVIAMWALMLAWSKPWLERYQYGPFEWLWRTLARWQVQPLRRALPA